MPKGIMLTTRGNIDSSDVNWFCKGPTSCKFLGTLFILSETNVINPVSPCSKLESFKGYPLTIPGKYTL